MGKLTFKGKKEEVKSNGLFEFIKTTENSEHIKDWCITGIYLGIELNAVIDKSEHEDDTVKKRDCLYLFDLADKKVKKLTVSMLTGKAKYNIKADNLHILDIIEMKYLGKKISPNDKSKKYNDYSFDIYDRNSNSEMIKELKSEIMEQVNEDYFRLFKYYDNKLKNESASKFTSEILETDISDINI